MASTAYRSKSKNVRYCGFVQEKFEQQIGVGIAEGYTELLTKRYFSDQKNIKNFNDSYVVEMGIVQNLEKIVGKNKLKKLYFCSDLKGLVRELKKYNDIENIIKFIRYLDITTLDLINKKTMISNRKYKLYLKYCVEFLLQSYINKLKMQLFNKEINHYIFEKKLFDFVENINKSNYLFGGKENVEKFVSDSYVLKILKKEQKKKQ